MSELFKSKVGVPVRVALFRHPALTYTTETVGDEILERCGYVRVSEYVETTFSALNNDAVAEKFVAALDIQEQQIRNEFQEKLDAIDTTRKNLLALINKA